MGVTSRVFATHGRFCARHPWEVIVTTLTLTLCILSVGDFQRYLKVVTLQSDLAAENQATASIPTWGKKTDTNGSCGSGIKSSLLEDYNAVDVIVMTLIRCVALLYTYHRLRTLHRLQSRYILGIAGLFTVFSSFVFTCSVINFLQSDISDLKDALFFFLLLIDLSKATLLAQWALSSSSPTTAEDSISQGLSVIGPTITLDTIVETLLIGVGTLSGVRRLEILCCFGCMSAIVNFVVFMTFYPACLALIIELSGKKMELEGEEAVLRSPASKNASSWQIKVLKQMLSKEEPNPVIQRVKLIMAAGLSIVHAHCRWPLIQDLNLDAKPSLEPGAGSLWGEAHATVQNADPDQLELSLLSKLWDSLPCKHESYVPECIGHFQWLSLRADQFVIVILLLALSIKFTFFDDREEERNAPHMHRSLSTGEKRIRRISIPSSWCAENDVNKAFLSKQADLRFAVHRTMSVMVEDDDDGEAITMEDKEVQTEGTEKDTEPAWGIETPQIRTPRPLGDCVNILKSEVGAAGLTDEEVLSLVGSKHIATYALEKTLGDANRSVRVRRMVLAQANQCEKAFANLPYSNYDYSQVVGVCCENVIGYIPVPLGVAGPLLMDGAMYYIPLATTEGCLVASTNRGCRAVLAGGGVRSQVVGDGMSRGPVVRLPNIAQASAVMAWLEDKVNLDVIKASFNSTSRFARLQKVQVRIAGRLLFIRFVAKTGDAMGMNMISKGTEAALKKLQSVFPELIVISLSGNYCTDKKPAAVNWIEGRGKSVVCEAVIPASVVENVLKTNVSALVELNITKNLVGSAMAGSIGGFNAHAANIVTAIFIATGQDPAQNVESSNCMTLMERWGVEGNDLYISCSMPSIEIGTLGGGTNLPPQASCLDLLGVRGANAEKPGDNAARLARLVCATVLAGELSLMSALAAGHLVKSHMTHNRSSAQLVSTT